MKIYTKTGDSGTTSLVGGTRISKDDIRLEAYGTVDELSAFVAVLQDSEGIDDSHLPEFDRIQVNLLVIESLLATENDCEYKKNMPQLHEEEVDRLERWIDELTDSLPPLRNLVIPGGHILSSKCHLCRTVCRRAERRIIGLSRQYPVNEVIMKYLNRLSDTFFVLSRYYLNKFNKEEKPWKP